MQLELEKDDRITLQVLAHPTNAILILPQGDYVAWHPFRA
jgi:hypothetical protein